jgi:hypothetical protein
MTEFLKLLEWLGIGKREQLYVYAKTQLGFEKKGIPDTAPKEVNCVEALNQIGIEVFGKPFCKGASTITLSQTLKYSTRFAKVTYKDALRGDIIVSPTQGANKGHTGIIGDNGQIYSNSSLTGKWQDHWDIGGWYKYYVLEKGLSIEFYRVIF